MVVMVRGVTVMVDIGINTDTVKATNGRVMLFNSHQRAGVLLTCYQSGKPKVTQKPPNPLHLNGHHVLYYWPIPHTSPKFPKIFEALHNNCTA